MRSVEFTVNIPIGDTGEYKTYTFHNVKDLCEKLRCAESTLYAIIRNECKFKHPSNAHLKGIIITKQTIYKENSRYYQKANDDSYINPPDKFQSHLINQLDAELQLNPSDSYKSK